MCSWVLFLKSSLGCRECELAESKAEFLRRGLDGMVSRAKAGAMLGVVIFEPGRGRLRANVRLDNVHDGLIRNTVQLVRCRFHFKLLSCL